MAGAAIDPPAAAPEGAVRIVLRQDEGTVPTLVFADGERKGEAVGLESDEFVIGRKAGCGLVLSSPKVSEQHARIERRGGRYYLKDLKSTNGTILNGAPVTEAEICQGDEVEIRPFRFYFFRPPRPAAAADPPAAAPPPAGGSAQSPPAGAPEVPKPASPKPESEVQNPKSRRPRYRKAPRREASLEGMPLPRESFRTNLVFYVVTPLLCLIALLLAWLIAEHVKAARLGTAAPAPAAPGEGVAPKS